MRSGRDYLASLTDGRSIYVDGRRIRDVRQEPVFQGILETVARMYDISAVPANGMSYQAPETGRPANTIFMIPRSREDLDTRRRALRRWAEATNGLVGRGPEHVGAFLAGFAAAPAVFDGEGGHYDNLLAFYKRALDEDLYVSYVIVPPQIDRSRPAAEQEFMQVGVLRETDEGLIVRGAQMLGTAATISNELFVSCIRPLRPDETQYAVSFAIPIETAGLKLYCRPLYSRHNHFDYPLSARFDETDALVVFDDVLVPWDRVFIYGNTKMVSDQFFRSPAHILGNDQGQIRLAVKLRFLVGLARMAARMSGVEGIPAIQEKLADLASIAAIVEGMEIASTATAEIDEFGVARPNPAFLYATISQQAELYPKALHMVREIVGGGPLQVPSSWRELVDEETAADMARYVQSPGAGSEDKLKLMRLVWDMIGTEFGGRHEQYEMFYVGAPHVAKQYLYRAWDFQGATGLVQTFLDSYGLPNEREGLEHAAG
jgi:4-hydroxyphenylacetate 3-monooxygenase